MYKRVYIILKNIATKDTLYVFVIHYVGLLPLFGLFCFCVCECVSIFSLGKIVGASTG